MRTKVLSTWIAETAKDSVTVVLKVLVGDINMSDHQEKFLLEQAAKPGLDIYDYIVILIQLSNYAARVAALAAAFWGYCLLSSSRFA